MDFVIYHRRFGRIDSVRSASGVTTADGILRTAFGDDAGEFGAVVCDGRDLTGKKVDPATGAIIDDPAWVPPATR